jgi:hypothetical protein
VAQEPRTAQERALDLLTATLATTSWLPDTPAKRLVWAIRCAIVLGVLVLIASAVDRTLWNWLDLLIIPVVLAIGGYWFNRQQQSREFAIAEQRSQDEALQAYLDKMSELLIDGQLRKEKDPYADKRITARAQTLAVLRQLADGGRKRTILLFLREARLINRKDLPRECPKVNPPIVGLRDADLTNANLRRAKLIDSRRNEPVSLEGANLEGAALQGPDLEGADLSDAILSGALLRGANLVGADLKDAKGLTQGQVDQAYGSYQWADNMPDTKLPDGLQKPTAWTKPLEEQKKST